MIAASREDIAEQLWLRDEAEMARAMLDADGATHRRVLQLAAEPGAGFFGHDRVDELLVTAAIAVLGGSRRKPQRWRAHPEDRLPQFWKEVGPDRDRRKKDGPFAGLLELLDGDG